MNPFNNNNKNFNFLFLFLILCSTLMFFSYNTKLSTKVLIGGLIESKIHNDTLLAYKEIHRNIMDGISKPVKVSVHGPAGNGYANKIYSLISAMVVALLTDSAFLVRWENIDLYIKEPFYKSFHNFSNQQNEFNADYDNQSVLLIVKY